MLLFSAHVVLEHELEDRTLRGKLGLQEVLSLECPESASHCNLGKLPSIKLEEGEEARTSGVDFRELKDLARLDLAVVDITCASTVDNSVVVRDQLFFLGILAETCHDD